MHERLSGSWHQDEMTGDGSTEVIKCVQPPNIFFPLSLVQYTLPKAWKSVGRGSQSKYNQSVNNPLPLQAANERRIESNRTSGQTEEKIVVNEQPEESTQGFHLEFTTCLLMLSATGYLSSAMIRPFAVLGSGW